MGARRPLPPERVHVLDGTGTAALVCMALWLACLLALPGDWRVLSLPFACAGTILGLEA